MGVNLAGVELILRLLEDMDDMRKDFEQQMIEYAQEAERRLQAMLINSNVPMRRDETLLPVPNIQIRHRKVEL
jgi:MerR family transcriptional regulator/heat shock protein HspR